jgi:energy-converting hydrogenase Eha subunit C
MRASHIVGLLLWRGGLLLVAGTVVYLGLQRLLRFMEMPLQLEIGVALLLSGLVMVLVSLVLENIQDGRRAREELG